MSSFSKTPHSPLYPPSSLQTIHARSSIHPQILFAARNPIAPSRFRFGTKLLFYLLILLYLLCLYKTLYLVANDNEDFDPGKLTDDILRFT